MKILNPQNNIIEKTIGTQKIDSTSTYHFSNYTLIFEYDSNILLHNTMTKELVSIDVKMSGHIKRDKSFLLNNELLIELAKKWFIINDNTNEKILYNQIFSFAKMFSQNDYVNNFTILPTTDCNARCFYCFELGCKRENMDLNTAKQTVDYIIKTSKGKKVLLQWFGGEPLYNLEIIDYICSELKKQNVPFKSKMVTNGYLFDENIFDKAKKIWNLNAIQITLDGTEDIYNKTKAYIHNDGISPFLKVYNNIKSALENNIFVKIRLNMDMYNIDDLYTLVDMLYLDFKDFPNFKIYPAILFEEIGADKRQRNDEERKDVFEKYFGLCKYLSERNLLLTSELSSSLKLCRCIADNDNAVVILPNGSLGKCEHFSEDEQFGNVSINETDYDAIASWKVRKPEIAECDSCLHYPNCIRLLKCKNGAPPVCLPEEREKNLFFLKESIIKKYKKTDDVSVFSQIQIKSNNKREGEPSRFGFM